MTALQTGAIALTLLIIIPLFWCLVVLLLSYVSGWQRLSATYATVTPSHGKRFSARSGKVGGVSYRSCLNVHAAPEGLFLRVPFFFTIGHKPLLIPWSAIHHEQEVKILWYRAVRFQIGQPSIARMELPPQILEAKPQIAA